MLARLDDRSEVNVLPRLVYRGGRDAVGTQACRGPDVGRAHGAAKQLDQFQVECRDYEGCLRRQVVHAMR